jgi:hypothetical protein
MHELHLCQCLVHMLVWAPLGRGAGGCVCPACSPCLRMSVTLGKFCNPYRVIRPCFSHMQNWYNNTHFLKINYIIYGRG